MFAAVMIVTHLSAIALGLTVGRTLGFRDAQPLRDARGKFIKKER